MTQSEILFEKFCANSGIKCEPIQTGETKTPDYQLTIDRQKIIVEVKEIERNKEEREYDRILEEGGIPVGSCTPGDRVRSKIKKSSPQIKALTEERYPSILVLFANDLNGFISHLGPYNIRVAMYGLEQIHLNVPINRSVSPYVTGKSYGAKRKMTETHNTSISAIGVLSTPRPDEIVLNVYHNKYATVKLDPNLLAKHRIKQFEIDEEVLGETAKWKELAVQN